MNYLTACFEPQKAQKTQKAPLLYPSGDFVLFVVSENSHVGFEGKQHCHHPVEVEQAGAAPVEAAKFLSHGGVV